MPPQAKGRSRVGFGFGPARSQDRVSPNMSSAANSTSAANLASSTVTGGPVITPEPLPSDDGSRPMLPPRDDRLHYLFSLNGSVVEPTTDINDPEFCDKVRRRLGRGNDDGMDNAFIKQYYDPGDRPYDVYLKVLDAERKAQQERAKGNGGKKSTPPLPVAKKVHSFLKSIRDGTPSQIARHDASELRKRLVVAKLSNQQNSVDSSTTLNTGTETSVGAAIAEMNVEQELGSEHGDNNFRDSAIGLNSTPIKGNGTGIHANSTAFDSTSRDSAMILADDDDQAMSGIEYVSFGDEDAKAVTAEANPQGSDLPEHASIGDSFAISNHVEAGQSDTDGAMAVIADAEVLHGNEYSNAQGMLSTLGEHVVMQDATLKFQGHVGDLTSRDPGQMFNMKVEVHLKPNFPMFNFDETKVPDKIKHKKEEVRKYIKREQALVNFATIQGAIQEYAARSSTSSWQITAIPSLPVFKLLDIPLDRLTNPAYSLGKVGSALLDRIEQLSSISPLHGAQLIRTLLKANRKQFRLYLSFNARSPMPYAAYGPLWGSQEKCIELLGMVQLLGCLFRRFKKEIDDTDKEELVPALLDLKKEEALLHKRMTYKPIVFKAKEKSDLEAQDPINKLNKEFEPDMEAQKPIIEANMASGPEWNDYNDRVRAVKNSNKSRSELLNLINCSDLLQFFEELAERSDRRQFTDDGHANNECIYRALNSAALEICQIIQFSEFKHNVHTCEVDEPAADTTFQDLLKKRGKTLEEAKECIRDGLQVLPEQSKALAEWAANDAHQVLHEHIGVMTLEDLWGGYKVAGPDVETLSFASFESAARMWHTLELPFGLLQTESGVLVVMREQAYRDGMIATLDFERMLPKLKKHDQETTRHEQDTPSMSDDCLSDSQDPEPPASGMVDERNVEDDDEGSEDLQDPIQLNTMSRELAMKYLRASGLSSIISSDEDELLLFNDWISKTVLNDLRYLRKLSKMSGELAMDYLNASGLVHDITDDEDDFVLLNDWKNTFPPSCPAYLHTGEFVDVKDHTEKTVSYESPTKKLGNLTAQQLESWSQQKTDFVDGPLRKILEQCQFALEQAEIFVPDLPMLSERHRAEFNSKSPRELYLYQLHDKLLWHRDYGIATLRTLRNHITKWQQHQSADVKFKLPEGLHVVKRMTYDLERKLMRFEPRIQPEFAFVGGFCKSANKPGGCTEHAKGLCFHSHSNAGKPCNKGDQCQYGEDCAFVHGKDPACPDAAAKPIVFCLKVNSKEGCQAWIEGVCPYKHRNFNMECKEFRTSGSCERADRCAFLHRKPAQIDLKTMLDHVLKNPGDFNICKMTNEKGGCKKQTCWRNHSLKGVKCPNNDDGYCPKEDDCGLLHPRIQKTIVDTPPASSLKRRHDESASEAGDDEQAQINAKRQQVHAGQPAKQTGPFMPQEQFEALVQGLFSGRSGIPGLPNFVDLFSVNPDMPQPGLNMSTYNSSGSFFWQPSHQSPVQGQQVVINDFQQQPFNAGSRGAQPQHRLARQNHAPPNAPKGPAAQLRLQRATHRPAAVTIPKGPRAHDHGQRRDQTPVTNNQRSTAGNAGLRATIDNQKRKRHTDDTETMGADAPPPTQKRRVDIQPADANTSHSPTGGISVLGAAGNNQPSILASSHKRKRHMDDTETMGADAPSATHKRRVEPHPADTNTSQRHPVGISVLSAAGSNQPSATGNVNFQAMINNQKRKRLTDDTETMGADAPPAIHKRRIEEPRPQLPSRRNGGRGGRRGNNRR